MNQSAPHQAFAGTAPAMMTSTAQAVPGFTAVAPLPAATAQPQAVAGQTLLTAPAQVPVAQSTAQNGPAPTSSQSTLEVGTAPSAASGKPPPKKDEFEVGDKVEAKCAGWGDILFPAVVREVLPNGDIQVLWEGDEPSISNVARKELRKRGGSDEPAGEASNEQGSTQTSSQAVPDPAVAGDAGKRPHGEESNGTSPSVVGPSELGPVLISFEARPEDDFSENFVSLRRRLEDEIRNGCRIAVSLVVTRPQSRPEVPASAPTESSRNESEVVAPPTVVTPAALPQAPRVDSASPPHQPMPTVVGPPQIIVQPQPQPHQPRPVLYQQQQRPLIGVPAPRGKGMAPGYQQGGHFQAQGKGKSPMMMAGHMGGGVRPASWK